jgi:hypothetical protein
LGQSIRLTYFETLAKCYKDLSNSGNINNSSEDVSDLKQQLEELEAQKLEGIEDEIKLHVKHQELQK